MEEAGAVVDGIVDSLALRGVDTETRTRERVHVRCHNAASVPVGAFDLLQPTLCIRTTQSATFTFGLHANMITSLEKFMHIQNVSTDMPVTCIKADIN